MSSSSIYMDLERILAPAGGGVHLVSTGLVAMQALQRAIYRAPSNEDIRGCWTARLRQLDGARALVLGVPSDTGAGFVRGANMGPAEIRRHLLSEPGHPIHDPAVVDVGDVRVIPHLLSQEMVSEEQLRRSRLALYGDENVALPITPLDQCALALRLLRELDDSVVPIVLGGDHSVGWPAFSESMAWATRTGRKPGLLHFDAHTDLLEERLGVRYCFATWAFHANELLGRDGRLVQVGIRASGKTREHWESTLGVRQYWPAEYQKKSTSQMIDEISTRFEERGVDCLYISNDIDGTDSAFASATGTPEANGLHPDQVSELSLGLAARFPLIGADLVEVAPTLGREGEPDMTLSTASRYLADMIRSIG